MDSVNGELVFLIVLLVGIGIYRTLDWYRSKEQQDLKAIALKILAAEKNLTYIEDGSAYLRLLRQNNLTFRPGARPYLKNILKSRYGPATIRVFDASHVISSGKYGKRVNVTGISVESDQLQLPYFELVDRPLFYAVGFFSPIGKVSVSKLPEAMRGGYSLYYDKSEGPTKVEQLFADIKGVYAISHSLFRFRLVGYGNRIILYQDGELETHYAAFCHMEKMGRNMFNMFKGYGKA